MATPCCCASSRSPAARCRSSRARSIPALYRLERQGLIESEWGVSDNNRRAKYYKLTTLGRQRMRDDAAAGTAWPTRWPRRCGRPHRKSDDAKSPCAPARVLARAAPSVAGRCGHERRNALPHRDGSAAAADSAVSAADEARAAGRDRVWRRREISRRRTRRAWIHVDARHVGRLQARAAHAREVSGPHGWSRCSRCRSRSAPARRISSSSTT